MSEAIYYDGWHTCANCGADKGGEDIWRDTCPRCAELADLHALCERQSDILSRVAVALRGPEPPQTLWGHHDLPERVAEIINDHICERCEAAIPLEHPCRCSACWNHVIGKLADLRANEITCGCGDHIGYSDRIGLSQDGAVCGNCAASRNDYDARAEVLSLRARLAALREHYERFRSKREDHASEALGDLLDELRALLAEKEAK